MSKIPAKAIEEIKKAQFAFYKTKYIIMNTKLEEILKKEGYENLVYKPAHGYCTIIPMAFTYGLLYGLDEHGYKGRYCYEKYTDAIESLKNWKDTKDPDDDLWIKHKGKTEYSNPLKNKTN